MKCIAPITVNGRQFNCGRCHACRVNYTSEWSLRLIYELSECDGASFITLTYSDDKRPGQLVKKDLTNFWKRLRKNLSDELHEFAPKIKYYACGEYGSITKREHFHAIVFGLDCWNDKHREILKKSWTFCEPWFFDKSRGRQSAMQEVTPDDISYVTGYVQKKLNGKMAEEEYGNKQPPFSVCSQGLGLSFAEKNKNRLLTNGFTYYKGHKVSIPRYFCKKFDVNKADLIKNTTMSLKELELSNSKLLQHFIDDMRQKNRLKNANSEALRRLFEEWYDNSRYAYSEAVWYDFKQRTKLRGKL